MPKIHFDMVLPFAYATVEQIHEFDILEPFGTGNDSPLFARKDVVVKSMRVLGKNRNAVKMQATDGDSGSLFTVMYFGNADYFIEELSQSKGRDVVEKMAAANGYMCGDDFKMDIVYSPGINEYNGNVTVQMIIKNFR
jgi:single-stranded-DNA-specific exonuclease